MSSVRSVEQVFKSISTVEGAGFCLKRAFGFHQVPKLDPFLLLDDFHSARPADYLPGFPWHPHRGIETVSYVLEGRVEHGDSMGNKGSIESGDVQWMTAGSGIVHQEMPHGNADGNLWGFQLWTNLPASCKMMAPRYQEIQQRAIPEVAFEGGIRVKLICGHLEGVQGPVRDIVTKPEYLDVRIPAKVSWQHEVAEGHTVFAYVIEGQGKFGSLAAAPLGVDHVVVFGSGDSVAVTAGARGVRFLLISGKPLGEPVAWAGPIVMNTEAELQTAFEEYENGTFLRH
jgi:redox-sensitive bicupin YhaK (pirin superfamily)